MVDSARMGEQRAQRAGLAENLPQTDGWKTVTEPEFVQWSQPGQTISGVVVSVERVNMRDGRPAWEVVLDNRGKLYKFYRGAHLKHRLEPGHIGQECRIRYLGNDPEAGTDSNPMQLFDLQYK